MQEVAIRATLTPSTTALIDPVIGAQAADCEVGAVATGHVHSRNRGSRVRNLLLSTTPEFLTSSLFSSN